MAVGLTDNAVFRQYGGTADVGTLGVGPGHAAPLITETLYALSSSPHTNLFSGLQGFFQLRSP